MPHSVPREPHRRSPVPPDAARPRPTEKATFVSHYKSNVRDLEFNLFEVYGLDTILAAGTFGDMDADTARSVLSEAARLAEGPVAAPYADADRNPPTFDPATGHLSKIVYGDNAPYADYITAHNHATDASREWVTRLIPTAEKTGVVIALENVSNNLWVTPELFRHFVASFWSPWVKAYYDIGNHVRFAPPEQWILTLGDLIAKIHVKDYLLDPADPDGRGRSVNIREGSVRWPVLRQALESINYTGWMTIESNGDIPFEERNRRLDLILAGK